MKKTTFLILASFVFSMHAARTVENMQCRYDESIEQYRRAIERLEEERGLHTDQLTLRGVPKKDARKRICDLNKAIKDCEEQIKTMQTKKDDTF